jgi:uncharacterized protein
VPASGAECPGYAAARGFAVIALLSPAKKLDLTSPLPDVAPTRPPLLEESAALLPTLKAMTIDQVAELMSISPDLAQTTWQRFQALELSGEHGRPAILSFAGDVYQGLSPRTLTVDDLRWAQDHVAILSGLYGLLRPLDRILAYRLEMGSAVRTRRGRDLVAFWRPVIAPQLAAALAEHPDPTVLNLASEEYFAAVDLRRVKAPVVHVSFQDVKNGQAKSLFLYVKRARGAAARWLIEHRAERAADLKDAVVDGYRFDASESTADRWFFRRPHPNA